MFIPLIAGIPLHLWLGMFTFLLVVFQVVSGRLMFNIPFVWHRRNGYAVLTLAILHGFLAFSVYFLGVPIR